LAGNTADSFSLQVPMEAAVGAVQVAMVNGAAVVHPSKQQLKDSTLRLVIAGKI
jgi:polyribonucleotide nucleotidyltransferase